MNILIHLYDFIAVMDYWAGQLFEQLWLCLLLLIIPIPITIIADAIKDKSKKDTQ